MASFSNISTGAIIPVMVKDIYDSPDAMTGMVVLVGKVEDIEGEDDLKRKETKPKEVEIKMTENEMVIVSEENVCMVDSIKVTNQEKEKLKDIENNDMEIEDEDDLKRENIKPKEVEVKDTPMNKRVIFQVKDDTGTIKVISWINVKIEKGQIVKIFGKIDKDRKIVVSNLQNVLSYDEWVAHTLLVTRHKLRNKLKMDVEECFQNDDDEWIGE